jgi:tetratricopeptide (TPR) repeat protein
MKARIALIALLALAPVSTSELAWAAPETPPRDATAVDEARQRFQKGVQLFHEWSFEAALAEFRKAYQLAPSYRLLYNIAQVHYELHNYVDALKAFRQYLTEGGTEVPTDRRTQVEAEIRKLEGRVGYIEVVANVEGQVSIDDVPVGLLPMKTPILVNPGMRRVSVTKPGFGTTARNVTIAGGDHAKVELELNEAVASARTGPDAGKKGTARGEASTSKPKTAMWISLAATGALGVGAGVFGLLAQDAKKDFEHELGVYPNTKAEIDDARSAMQRNAAITDGLAAAAIVAAGFTVYFAVSSGGKDPVATTAPATQPRIGFAPTFGGVAAVGSF